jgi:hypothetical protein
MKKVFYKRDKVELFVDTEPFASGGEGNLYRIRKPAKYAKFVVKLYHQGKRTQARQQKVEYMIANPPIDYAQQDHYPVIWPQGLIFERSGFAGFLMPFADGEKLEILCMPRLHRSLQARWGRFDFARTDAVGRRLKLCFNIATAVYQVHATDHYVLVDLKTDNIIIQNNGFISIVDMDSVEIIEGNKVLFPATVTTPEYTPPEYYTKNVQPGKQPIYESWDLFSLSIIFYKLLFGIHPYAASCNPPYDKMVSLHQKIEAGLFVHSASKASYFKVVPPPHRKFSAINTSIQSLFIRTFEEGHDQPETRPDADEWCWAIAPAPRLSIDRPLPSKLVNIGKVTYSKPLHVATDTSQILPSVPPPKLPMIPPADFSSSMLIPRGIAGGATALFLIWMFSGGLSFMFSGMIQFAAFVASTTAMLYAYYREIPESKQQRLIAKELKILRLQRKNTNTQLVNMKTQIINLPNKQKAITRDFKKYQHQNLIREKKEIESLIQELRGFVMSQDKRARDLLKEEMEETQALQKKYFGATYEYFKRLSRMSVKEQLEWLQKEKEASERRIELKYRQQMSNVQQAAEQHKADDKAALKKLYNEKLEQVNLDIKELEKIKNQEVNQIKKIKQIKVGEQLRRYGIRDNAQIIFSDNGSLIGVICDYLERNGVRSAADFEDVNAEGKVKKVNGQNFEKVPFMTPDRGKQLKVWLNNLKNELGKSEELTADEEAQINTRFDDTRLRKQIEAVKFEYYQAANKLSQNNNVDIEKNKVRTNYQEELTKTNEKIEEAINLLTTNKEKYEIEENSIKDKFNTFHELISTQTAAFQAEINTKIQSLNNSTFSQNNALLNKVTRQIETVTSSSEMNAILNFNEKQKTLNELDKLFYELKGEDDSLKNLSFEQYLRKIVKFIK